jgi:hypothetical protein
MEDPKGQVFVRLVNENLGLDVINPISFFIFGFPNSSSSNLPYSMKLAVINVLLSHFGIRQKLPNFGFSCVEKTRHCNPRMVLISIHWLKKDYRK